MFSVESRDLIKKAIVEETINAKKNYGTLYHSNHEGYAVVKEEVEEVIDCTNAMNNFMSNLWENIKQDNDIMPDISKVYDAALYAALECLQVCACCNKLMGKDE